MLSATPGAGGISWCHLASRVLLLLAVAATSPVSAGKTPAGTPPAALIEQAYQRMQFMVRASHILLALPEDAGPEAVALTTQTAESLKRRIESGEQSFGAVAATFSDDPSVSSNRGELGYFTVFEQPYAIENAAYMTAVGELSAPVRSRFGVHLVMPTERIALTGTKTAAHIMLRDSSNAARRIAAIRAQADADNFGALARQFSEDLRTRNLGGDLGTDRLVDSLEAVRLRLEPGEISSPVRSPSGWHIMMVTALEPFPSLPAMRSQLIDGIRRDGRGQLP